MDIRERIDAYWAGERPDEIPYTIYRGEWGYAPNDPAWDAMYEAGLGVTFHIGASAGVPADREVLWDEYVEGGESIRRQTLRTSVGELTQTWANGWHRKYLLETPDDYRIMTHIVRNTSIESRVEAYVDALSKLPPHGIGLLAIGRTPLQTILVDYAGLENFAFHLADFEDAVRDLYDALLANFRHVVEIAATVPGRFVSNLENFTAETLGPVRYAEYLLPVYEECFPVLHDAGKIVGSHYDGRTAACAREIARAPIDMIESLTEPNEGDLPLDECRSAWPDKLLWVNIRVGDYQLPRAKLRDKVLDLVRQAAPDGTKLAFEVSEHCPRNWKDSMPVVLKALKETRA